MNTVDDHDLTVKQIVHYLVDIAELKLRYESFKTKEVERVEFNLINHLRAKHIDTSYHYV